MVEFPWNLKLLVNYFWQHGCHSITETDLPPWFGCGLSISAKWSWLEIHQNKEKNVFHGVSLNFHIVKKLLVIYFRQHWCHFHKWNRLFLYNSNVAYTFLQSVSAKVEWKFVRIKENSVFHWASLNFHQIKSYLWIISDNMIHNLRHSSTIFRLINSWAGLPSRSTNSLIGAMTTLEITTKQLQHELNSTLQTYVISLQETPPSLPRTTDKNLLRQP